MIPRKFPHFKPIETDIMKRFLARGFIVGDYIFDFRLPWTKPPGFETLKFAEQKMLESIHQKRIDAVCQTDYIDYLIEVKKKANTMAIGELAVYETLYRKKTNTTKKLVKVIVCDILDPDLEETLKLSNIVVYKV